MKDWGLSFQNKKSAKIFFKILKEGVPNQSSDESEPSEEMLGKRDSLWSDEEEPRESDEGNRLDSPFFREIKLLFDFEILKKLEITQEINEMGILRDLDLKGLDKLLKFDEVGNVQIKSDKAGTFLVKLHSHSTFWRRLQEEFVKNELLWETDSGAREVAKSNILDMFQSLVKLLMVFDEDLTDTLLGPNFFSTFRGICQFVLSRTRPSSGETPRFEDYRREQQRACGPLFLRVSETSFRERLFKMKYLYTYFLSSILPENKNETLTVRP